MMIAFCSLDPVNEHLALELAESFDDTLCPLYPKDGPPDGLFDAVIYDLDHWPADCRRGLLAGLCQEPPPCPVAVCSYNLDEGEIKALNVRGVAVFTRLGPDVFRALR
jgi:hypothetical protein